MPVIKVENLSKSYLIGHQKRENYIALRDVMAHKLRGIAQRIRHPLSPNKEVVQLEEFWALKDINLEIKQGERVGIIGRNGAGKSTLLKILSRITEPTTGGITIKGRVASLLEVGTGFHPELTGNENIYLNGAILGMSKKEIKRKFDEIVAFADVEKFLDTPVKRYSSGMYVRLAFAVAAHLEPEILIVDEVLAVGDAQFQKKCLGKMEEVGKEGRTVLFVSHNMAAVQSLCTSAIYLEQGELAGIGDIGEQITRYLTIQQKIRSIDPESKFLIGNNIRLERFEFDPNPAENGCPVKFSLELTADHSLKIDSIAIILFSSLKQRVGIIDLRKMESYIIDPQKPLHISGEIKSLPLVEGEYSIGLYYNTGGSQETIAEVFTLDILNSHKSQNTITPYPPHARGLVEFEAMFK